MGFGPPVEVGAPFEEIGRGFEDAAAFGDDGVEPLDGFEVFVGDGLVEHRPEAFGRLPLRTVARQIDEAEAVGQAGGPVRCAIRRRRSPG